jgi:predicted nucleotidyltransferase
MNNTGLTETDLQEIISILKSFPEIQQALIFGSRAKGNYKNGSDVDLALKGPELTFSTVARIRYLLNEETRMPYTFDVVQFETITSLELIGHINRVGTCIYTNPSA